MEFIAGPNRWNRWFQPFLAALNGGNRGSYPAIDPEFELLPDFNQIRDSLDILCWEMKAGDAIVFHGLTVHGARGNTSTHNRRRGYAIRYADAPDCELVAEGKIALLANKILLGNTE